MLRAGHKGGDRYGKRWGSALQRVQAGLRALPHEARSQGLRYDHLLRLALFFRCCEYIFIFFFLKLLEKRKSWEWENASICLADENYDKATRQQGKQTVVCDNSVPNPLGRSTEEKYAISARSFKRTRIKTHCHNLLRTSSLDSSNPANSAACLSFQ